MLTTTRAIVLHTIRYGDGQVIVDLLTEQLGRMQAIVHISKSRKGQMKKQLFQPATLLDLELDHRERANLQRLRSARITLAYTTIPMSAVKMAQAMFCAEFLSYVSRGETDCGLLFNYVADSMAWLDAATGPTANFHLVFMLRLSRFVGFYPNLDDYADGSWFDLREGRFTMSQPLHNDVVGPAEAAMLSKLMRMNYQTMHLFRMSHNDRNHITELIVNYYRLHTPQMPEMKTLGVLRELFE